MTIKDHFLTQENFQLTETDIPGVYKTSPIPKELDKYYETVNYISHHQDAKSFKVQLYKFFQRFNLKYKSKILKSEIDLQSPVLDYGCGAGEFLHFIENDYKTFGFEPNISARNAAASKLHRSVLLENINDIADESLGAITLWHVFEHVGNPEELLDTFHRKLKPEGCLIIAVPNHTSYDAVHYGEYWAAYDVPRHLYHYTRKGMTNFLKDKTWKLKKVKPLRLDSFYISMLSEKYKKSALIWLKGAVFGTISNFKASKTGEYSSLIYVIGKN
ncbi:class I SAM-dependent methyltransferase [Kaistella palustris]|uniref:class I SAM-dependent methyltransferase n=1 Tax=Kaistella palustris TaxID=493376 RepID=UPI0003FC21F0|nr:class I SAM-dependent methyltransferase [Kaistella palustris]